MGEVEADYKASSFVGKLIEQVQEFTMCEHPEAVIIRRGDVSVMVQNIVFQGLKIAPWQVIGVEQTFFKTLAINDKPVVSGC